jgi:mycothiol synthase
MRHSSIAMDAQAAGQPQLHMRRALVDLPEPRVPDGYLLRRLAPADLPAWVDLMVRNGELGAWSVERATPLFADQMDLQASFVVERAGVAVATAQLNPHGLDTYAPTPELGWVAADPGHRGRGLGRAVCLAVLRAAAAAGHREIFLRTDDHRLPAIRVYLALGFEPWLRDPTAAARWRAIAAV